MKAQVCEAEPDRARILASLLASVVPNEGAPLFSTEQIKIICAKKHNPGVANSANICLAPTAEGHCRVIAARTDGDVALRPALGKKKQTGLFVLSVWGRERGGGAEGTVAGVAGPVRLINPHLLVLDPQRR